MEERDARGQTELQTRLFPAVQTSSARGDLNGQEHGNGRAGQTVSRLACLPRRLAETAGGSDDEVKYESFEINARTIFLSLLSHLSIQSFLFSLLLFPGF